MTLLIRRVATTLVFSLESDGGEETNSKARCKNECDMNEIIQNTHTHVEKDTHTHTCKHVHENSELVLTPAMAKTKTKRVCC